MTELNKELLEVGDQIKKDTQKIKEEMVSDFHKMVESIKDDLRDQLFLEIMERLAEVASRSAFGQIIYYRVLKPAIEEIKNNG